VDVIEVTIQHALAVLLTLQDKHNERILPVNI
jgi:hypothetical protein